MASIEEKVEEHYKKILDELGIRHYGKTESINRTITEGDRYHAYGGGLPENCGGLSGVEGFPSN